MGRGPRIDAAQVVRLDIAGRLDVSFGTGGALQPNCSSECSVGGALDVMPDGRVVTRGTGDYLSYGFCQSIWLDRFLPDGQPDLSFGTVRPFQAGHVGGMSHGGQFVVSPSGRRVLSGLLGAARGLFEHTVPPLDRSRRYVRWGIRRADDVQLRRRHGRAVAL